MSNLLNIAGNECIMGADLASGDDQSVEVQIRIEVVVPRRLAEQFAEEMTNVIVNYEV